jgi:hypothetical protein
MTDKKTIEVIASHEFECEGIDKLDLPVLGNQRKSLKPETVFLHSYKNGTTDVLCRYIKESNSHKCSAHVDESEWGYCPYYRG